MDFFITYADAIQGIGSLIAVVISVIFGFITALQAGEQLKENKQQSEREYARRVSAWRLKGKGNTANQVHGVVISNKSESPIYDVTFHKDEGKAFGEVSILPPGIWFFNCNDNAMSMINKWDKPVPVSFNEYGLYGYTIKYNDSEISLEPNLTAGECEVTINFCDNNGIAWENSKGKLEKK